MSLHGRTGQRILVGVDGSRASRSAVLWAAQEARIRRGQLVITHVDPPTADAVGLSGEPVGSETMLEASAAAASLREPSVIVATLLLQGPVTDELINLSRSVSMLVVGVDPSRPRAACDALGPVEDRVVVHARCPVVTVSRDPQAKRPSRPEVVVGWTNDDSGHLVLGVAAQEASARSASLTLVSVPEDDQRRPDHGGADQPGSGRGQLIAEAVVAVGIDYPQLPVDVVQGSGEVVSSLIRQAHSAELLVVDCPHTEDRWSIRTGSVVRALMSDSPCPLMLVGRSTPHPAPGAAGFPPFGVPAST